jgi:hypothetical protein
VVAFRVGPVLRNSLRVWRSKFWSLTALAALLELPLVVGEIVVHVVPGVEYDTDKGFTLGLGGFVLALYGSLSHHFLAGLLERVVGSDRHGSPQASIPAVLRNLPWLRLLAADLLLTAMIVVGLGLFVVPGLVVLAWFSIALPLINMEWRPVLPTGGRSYRLVRGHSWRALAVALISFAVPELLINLLAGAAHNATEGSALDTLAHAVPATFLMPIAALPLVIMAFDLVELDANREHAATAR